MAGSRTGRTVLPESWLRLCRDLEGPIPPPRAPLRVLDEEAMAAAAFVKQLARLDRAPRRRGSQDAVAVALRDYAAAVVIHRKRLGELFDPGLVAEARRLAQWKKRGRGKVHERATRTRRPAATGAHRESE